MTKKDYELIAYNLNILVKSTNALRQEVEGGLDAFRTLATIEFVVNQFVNGFMKDLAEENIMFNSEKFLTAVNKK